MWGGGGGGAPWVPGTGLTQVIGADPMVASVTLALASSISGAVDGDVGYGDLEYDLWGVHVLVYEASSGLLMGDAWTDSLGKYTVYGLPGGTGVVGQAPTPVNYKVYFDPSYEYDGDYYAEWWNNQPDYPNATLVPIAHGGINVAGIYALLQEYPWLWGIHPESAANDGPNRFATEVTIAGWGSDFISSI
jgi:hypothetical protein